MTDLAALQESPHLHTMEREAVGVIRRHVDALRRVAAAWEPRPLPADWPPTPPRKRRIH